MSSAATEQKTDARCALREHSKEVIHMEKQRKRSLRWLFVGIILSMVASGIFMSLYGMFEEHAKALQENPIESVQNVRLLYDCNQVLYRDLYNSINKKTLNYTELYYPIKEEILEYGKYAEGEYEVPTEGMQISDEVYDPVLFENIDAYRRTVEELNRIEYYFSELEGYFGNIGILYDYYIRDTVSGRVITNAESEQNLLSGDGYYFKLEFDYDDEGIPTVGEALKGENAGQIRRYAADMARTLLLPSDTTEIHGHYYGNGIRDIQQYVDKNYITNCQIIYGMKAVVWEQLKNGTEEFNLTITIYPDYFFQQFNAYQSAGIGNFYGLFLLVMLALAFVLPYITKGEPWEAFSLCRMPLEGLVLIGMFLLAMNGNIISLVENANNGQLFSAIRAIFHFYSLSNVVFYGLQILCLSVLFFTAWYIGISLRLMRETGIWGYVKKRSLIYRFFPFIKSKCMAFYQMLESFDLTLDARKTLIKLLVVNAVILFIISSLWVGGFFITAIYSVVLYIVLKKYISDIQKKYGILLNATNEIAEGNLNVIIPEHLGVFEPFKPQVYRIQWGLKKALEEETKSQRMKAELVTNVSHDLKTPLTAIITYVGLLKEDGIIEEERKEYLDTLEHKSLRLKVLIEDLFEISKATSKTVQLNIMDVDILNLVKQVEIEMADKLKSAGLEVRMGFPDGKLILPLDSQKTYRVYENLFGNIAKYALPGTRVYVSCNVTAEEVSITLRNITAEEIHVNPEELTDRFVRGDASRNTEGSGLGLAIAKSFVELQNGRLLIELDEDLFKVTTIWKRPMAQEGDQPL